MLKFTEQSREVLKIIQQPKVNSLIALNNFEKPKNCDDFWIKYTENKHKIQKKVNSNDGALLWKFSTQCNKFKFLNIEEFYNSDESSLTKKTPDPINCYCGGIFSFGKSTNMESATEINSQKNSKTIAENLIKNKTKKSILANKINQLFDTKNSNFQSVISRNFLQNRTGNFMRIE